MFLKPFIQQQNEAEEFTLLVSEKDTFQPTESKYKGVSEQNPDFFGWILIPDTKINYPVMYTLDDPEYYLYRAFDKSESSSGTPFMDGNCFYNCGNYSIFGHNMNSGTMFAGLLKYKDENYYKNHSKIYFDTLKDLGEYEVMAAFYSKAYDEADTDVFRYYNYTNLLDEDTFDEYINKVKSSALYDTGVDARYGDQLITLSTCSYHTDNGRFVVVARQTSSQEIN